MMMMFFEVLKKWGNFGQKKSAKIGYGPKPFEGASELLSESNSQ